MIKGDYLWPGSERWTPLWPTFSIDDCFRRSVDMAPEKPAIVDPARDTTISFAELDHYVDRLVGGFGREGLARGDVVAVQLPNWWEFVAIYLATVRAGLVISPLSPAYRRAELQYMLRVTGARLLVTPTVWKGVDYSQVCREAALGAPALRGWFAIGDIARAAEDVQPFNELLGSPVHRKTSFDSQAAAFILFTSGSEAKPKAVVHSHATSNYSLVACTDLWGVSDEDVVLVPCPVSHGAGFNWCMREALYVGATQVLLEAWIPQDAVRHIIATGCTFTYAPTRFLQDLLSMETSQRPMGLKTFASGGSPIPRHFVQAAERDMGCRVLATYGQTECFVATSTRLEDSVEKISSTDGRAIPGAEVRIVDADGHDVPVGREGMCVTRGPHLGMGYLSSPKAVQQFDESGGWLVTGDVCTMDEDGYIRVVGREKEIVIRNGLNISPAEIEEYLLRLDEIRDAAVVGYPDEAVGERVCAVVVRDPGSKKSLTVRSIDESLTVAGLARYKHPERLLVVDEIPRSAVGKVQRLELRRMLTEMDDLSA